jgi:hypothetical protein
VDLLSWAVTGSEAVVDAEGLRERCFAFSTGLSLTPKHTSLFDIDDISLPQVTELETYS